MVATFVALLLADYEGDGKIVSIIEDVL